MQNALRKSATLKIRNRISDRNVDDGQNKITFKKKNSKI